MTQDRELTSKQRACIELEIENPSWTYKKLSEELNVHSQTIWNWMHKPKYIEERERRLKEEWRASTKKAQEKMLELMETGKPEVSFNAAKYILDSAGYKPTENVSIESNVYTYEIDYGEDES